MTTSSSSFKQLSDGNPNGTMLGQGPNDLISFYGGASSGVAVAQSTVSNGGVGFLFRPPVNATSGGSGTTWAFDSSTQAQAVVGLLWWAYQAGLIK